MEIWTIVIQLIHLTIPSLYQLSYFAKFSLKIAIHKDVKVDFLLISVTHWWQHFYSTTLVAAPNKGGLFCNVR